MSKHKAKKPSRRARSTLATKAQRASQAVVRSPKPRGSLSVGRASAASSSRVHSGPEAAVFEQPAAIPVHGKPTMASHDDSQRTMRNSDLAKPFNVFSTMANVGAYQRRLSDVAQAYMQLPFEFAQRLAQIKSSFEIPSVFAELATKQFTIFQNLVVPNQNSRSAMQTGSSKSRLE